MDSAMTLKLVGQIAGIGGLALGVLLLVFREVIRKSIFPMLAAEHAYKIIRLIVFLTFLIAAGGIAAWVVTQPSETRLGPALFPKADPDPEIRRYLALVDTGKFSQAWDSLSDEAHRRITYEGYMKTFEVQRAPLGRVVERKLSGIAPYEELPDRTRGAFNTTTFVTQFQKGPYVEAVTVIGEGTQWKVLFHQLAPCAPPACNPD